MDEGCNSFENAIPFFEAAKISAQTARAQLQKSGERLGFNIDPFLLPISSHRQLRGLNENAYMDWFAWALDVACQNTSQPLSLCTRLLSLNEDAIQASDHPQARPIITREVSVDKGDTLGAGRLDLLIIFQIKKMYSILKRRWLMQNSPT